MASHAIQDILDRNSSDPRTRLEIGPQLYETIKIYGLSSDTTLLTRLCDTMAQWLGASNFKVALMALEVVEICLSTSGDLLAPYLLDNMGMLSERLGDTKDAVRQQAHDIILKFMAVPHSSPQLCMDKLINGFQHKQCYGSYSLNLSKYIPPVCKNMSDAQAQVRDTASDTLVSMYIVIGDDLVRDIMHKRLIPDTKLACLRSRFQGAKNAGLVGENGEPLEENTVPDCAPSILAFKTPTRATNSPGARVIAKPNPSANRRMRSNDDDNHSVKSVGSSKSRSISQPRTRFPVGGRSSAGAGAVSEEFFLEAFEDCPKIQLVVHTQQIKDILSDINNDWEKRVEALKKLRSLMVAGATNYEEFHSELKVLEVPFQLSAKDLRSQVVREACITIAFLSVRLGLRLEHFSEAVLHALVNMIQNSAKIMASSAMVACRFIIKNVQSPKLVPLVTSYLNSKSREIRRACIEFVVMMMDHWPLHALERNMPNIREAIRAGLCDPDVEARAAAKKGYHSLAQMSPEHAEQVFQTLDPSRQKQLGDVSASSSSQSLGGGLRRSQENLNKGPAVSYQKTYYGGRSTSDIDAGAARRAMQRAMVARNKPPLQPMNSLQRPPPKRPANIPLRGLHTPDNHKRTTARTPSKSVSQPGSRSGSPSRLPFSARKVPPRSNYAPGRSQGGSREHSPTRVVSSGYGRRFSQDAASPPTVNGARNLVQSREMERVFLDALICRKRDDADESGSVCSEKSFCKYEQSEVGEALRLANSHQWSERKDGLNTLLILFRNQKPFTVSELRRVCDTFTRMFVDPHNKTFNLFLDVLVDFLASYRSQLCDWLYVLLTRLLTKLGTDMLASVQTKLQKTLEVVRESFPYEIQFTTLVRYINDPVQTPSIKVKTAVLNYMRELAHVMDAKSLTSNSDTRQAVLKVVTWSQDPKSNDVRRASNNLLVALFSLNASVFTQMLSTFTKQNGDMVYKLLQTQLNSSGVTGAGGDASFDRYSRSSLSPGPRASASHSFDMCEVHDRLRETSAQIQNTFSTIDKGSQDSGIVDATDAFGRSDELVNGHARLMMSLGNDEERQKEIIEELLTELSNHNTRFSERVRAMCTLKQMTRDGSLTLWDENFKTALLLLLESLGDKDSEIRINALKCMKEICLAQSIRFRDFSDLTLLKLLEAHKDPVKDVVRAADECSSVLVTHLPPKACLRLLNPVINNDCTPALLAAIKMTTKVIEQLSQDELEAVLADTVPGIVKAAEDTDSGVRKASVLALVAMHNNIGFDALKPYLDDLSNSKVKLLNLYVKRAQSSSAGAI